VHHLLVDVSLKVGVVAIHIVKLDDDNRCRLLHTDTAIRSVAEQRCDGHLQAGSARRFAGQCECTDGRHAW